MFQKLLEAIKSLFSTLFGGSQKENNTPVRPKPVVISPEEPQDASEVTPDSVIVVVNEMDHIIIRPTDEDVDFDDDIFDNRSDTQPEPAPEREVIVITPTINPDTVEAETPQPPANEPDRDETPAAPKGRYLWCLDNGHGKKTSGKRSPLFSDGTTQFLEYEFNRDIVKRISKQLDEYGIRYFITVPEEDIDDFLEGRVNRANEKASDIPKIFVSVHSNAAPAATANTWAADSIKGIETWFYHGSKRGQKLASIFQKYLLEKTGFQNRHIKSKPQGQFYVLRKTQMTSVLTENGFYNNKGEAAELMKPEVRQKIADAHVAAILEVEKDGL
ncbi:MAG TPA: N-acetylmuramoyl-L-alanine amidase [Saprospiraceae bacterium]|nr:N-acetylmuramoyl-L-alanine amidase [Saprospiraceae bacterium]HMQ82042.1 N-acetylmuramoyl-L-alanine amidase [Saprospiraceae bacterium]